ncbi:hypothetical protein [Halorarum halophilum]|nr:hypothetical protein [Halobaculum halophilum]
MEQKSNSNGFDMARYKQQLDEIVVSVSPNGAAAERLAEGEY